MSGMATGDVPAVVPFRGLHLQVSRHPLPSRGGPALSSSPDAFGEYALPGLDTMDIEDEVDPLGRVSGPLGICALARLEPDCLLPAASASSLKEKACGKPASGLKRRGERVGPREDS